MMQKTTKGPLSLSQDIERNLELMERTAAVALKGPRGKPQVRALFALVRLGGVAAQTEVEQRLQVHSSQITRYVEVLVNQKMVVRDRDSGPDRRKVNLHLTPKGLDFVLRIMSPDGSVSLTGLEVKDQTK